MNRCWTRIAVVALIALLTGAELAGATNPPSPRPGTLRGHIVPSGHAKLLIHYRHAHHERVRWYRWHFYRVPLKCKGGPAVSRITVKGGEGIWNKYADRNPFGGVLLSGRPSSGATESSSPAC
jgi:hypothetical protein